MRTIMVVDDEPGEKRLFQMYFNKKGYNVIRCSSGKKCLEKLQSGSKPKYIFLDIFLSDEIGCELCKKIRSNDKFKDIIIVLMSSLPEKEMENKRKECKADYYIEKGTNFAETEKKIEQIINM